MEFRTFLGTVWEVREEDDTWLKASVDEYQVTQAAATVIPKMEIARSKEMMLRVLNEKLAILEVLRDATISKGGGPPLKAVDAACGTARREAAAKLHGAQRRLEAR